MSTPLPYRLGCLRRIVDSLTESLDTEQSSTPAHEHPSGSSSSKVARNACSKAPIPPPMRIVLEGMPVNGRAEACDFIMPHVRRSPLANGPIQHLDVVSCWKGLKLSQACELATWDYFFKECLAMQIKEHLEREFSRSLRQTFPAPRTLRCMVERMEYFFERSRSIWINVDMLRLVDDMIGRMYTAYRSDTAQRRFPWTLSSGDMPSLVYNYVHAQDCLSYSVDGPSVHAGFSSRYSQGDMVVYVDLHGQYEKTSFMGLRDSLPSGKSYRITPFTEVAGDSSNGRCNFTRASSEVKYSIGKSPLPLQWDDEQECFHSIVHRGTQDQNGMIVTVVCAKIITPFHDGVRFERISRYSLKLKVDQESLDLEAQSKLCDQAADIVLSEPGSPWVPSYSHTPLSKTGLEAPGQAGNVQMHDTPPQDSSLRQMDFDFRPSISTEQRVNPFVLGGTPSKLPSPPNSEGDLPVITNDRIGNSRPDLSPEELLSGSQHSPGKRKALQSDAPTPELSGSFALDKVEHPDLSVDPKRRKVAQHEDPDIVIDDSAVDAWLDNMSEEDLFDRLSRISTGLMGSAQSPLSIWYKKRENGGSCLSSKTTASSSAPKPHVASFGANKQTTFVWPNPYYSLPSAAPRIDEVLDSSTDEISPTTASSAASSIPLSQGQIQRNYQEFAQRQQDKAAERAYYTATIPGFDGVVSPTDTEGKAFERIFLDDAKDMDAGD